jgi:hypothetical protein
MIANHILKAATYKTWAAHKPASCVKPLIEVMDVSCRSSLCPHVTNDGSSPGNRGTGPAQGGTTVAGRPEQLGRSRPEHAQGAAVRQNIANIAVFVMSQTVEMQLNPDPAKLKSLIDINCNIAAGLAGQT